MSRMWSFIFLFVAVCVSFSNLSAQPDTSDLRTKAFELISAQKFTEALPLLEKLATIAPNDPDVQRNLGFALLGQSKTTADKTAAKVLRARSRQAFVAAKNAGENSQLVAAMIESLPVDGGVDATFGGNAKAEEVMQKAEAAFSSGKMDEALKLYQEALKIDPKLYHAALFSGDVFMHKEDFGSAEIWYQKAIAIDPYIETAYRYSATPLMKQKKYDQARERYIEAWITEPYSRLAISGIIQWGQATNTTLSHPKIDIPKTTVGADGKLNTTINISPQDDGSMAWIAYTATRETWKKEKFAKTFPGEKTYRHSLQEEADALRSVVTMAKTTKPKQLNQQIALIEQMDKDGVLEAFILVAIPDQGIAKDHAAYLRSNREKLRLYVQKYVIGGSPKG